MRMISAFLACIFLTVAIASLFAALMCDVTGSAAQIDHDPKAVLHLVAYYKWLGCFWLSIITAAIFLAGITAHDGAAAGVAAVRYTRPPGRPQMPMCLPETPSSSGDQDPANWSTADLRLRRR